MIDLLDRISNDDFDFWTHSIDVGGRKVTSDFALHLATTAMDLSKARGLLTSDLGSRADADFDLGGASVSISIEREHQGDRYIDWIDLRISGPEFEFDDRYPRLSHPEMITNERASWTMTKPAKLWHWAVAHMGWEA